MDQADADGIGIGGLSVPESATPPPGCATFSIARSPHAFVDKLFKRRPGIIMPATLHDRAPTPY